MLVTMEELPPVSEHETGLYEILQENKLKTESKKTDHDEDDDSDQPNIQHAAAVSNTSNNIQAEKNEQTQHLYYDWVYIEEAPEYMKCSIICCNVFTAPQLLTCCGKNVCKRCIDSYIQRVGLRHKPSCPHCRKEGFRLIPNTALELSINQLKVECLYQKNGCDWNGSLKHGKLHLEECKFVLVGCPNQCGCPKFERGRLRDHVITCPLQHINCPFQAIGCDSEAFFLRTEWRQGHAVSSLHQHLLLIAQESRRLSSECELTSSLRNSIYERAVKENAEMICSQKGILKSLKLAMSSLGDYSLQEIKNKIRSLQQVIAAERICLAELERRNKQLESTKASITTFTEAVKTLRVPSKDIETYAYYVYHPSSPMPITFTIDNFRKRIATNDIWLSPPFYTHSGGYKMLIFVYPNGYGNAGGKSVSVGLHLMSGEYDDYLKWPFPGAIITLTAINRRGMDSKSEYFQLAGEDTLCIRLRELNFDDILRRGLRISRFLDHKVLSSFLDYRNHLKLKLYRIQFLPL